MTAKALHTIADDLAVAISEPEIDRDAIRLAVTRINAQAEMLERGLAE